MTSQQRKQYVTTPSTDSPPVASALTLCVDVDEEGIARAVMGRMDLVSRRYVFTHFNQRLADSADLSGCASSLVSFALEFARDVDTSPF
ncbi:MAG TPA: hypothetical protein VFE93_04980 [Myxococcaceae bacterium]|nr:hypothetical protein [Myxococcaceae bacterium]